jgi:hypothetical protein
LLGEPFAVGLGVGVTAGALQAVFDPNPKVDAVGVTLPVITTRYRMHPPSSAQLPEAAQ